MSVVSSAFAFHAGQKRRALVVPGVLGRSTSARGRVSGRGYFPSSGSSLPWRARAAARAVPAPRRTERAYAVAARLNRRVARRYFQMAPTASNHDQDFRAHLIEQLGFLDASARAHDEGIESEGKRLAATVRTLVHDGPGSRSLLTHLAVRDRLPWTDTAAGVVREAALTIGSGLCITRTNVADGVWRFAAPLGTLPPERIHPGAAFVDWWGDTVLTDAGGNEFSRRDLVLRVANKDGELTLTLHCRRRRGRSLATTRSG